MAEPRGSLPKRDLILKAAIKVFARQGYYNCRVADISEEAGIAYGLIYRYFPSKDDVLIAIYQENTQMFLNKIEQINRDFFDPRDKLRCIMQFIFKNFQQNPDLVKVMIMDIPMLNRFYDEENQKLYELTLEGVATIVREGQEKGLFNKNISPMMASHMLNGSVEMTIRQCVYRPQMYSVNEISIKDATDQILEVIIKGLSIEKSL
jgi:TetR/AcrR family transcriptional regulator, fatty acid metabolism regulator protein